MKFAGALLAFVVLPLAAQTYRVDLAPEDRKLEGRSTITLKTAGGPSRKIVFERTRKDRALPVIDTVLVDGTCDPASTEASGCDRARIDLESGHIETRSFALGKGIVLDLDGLGTLMQDVPLRITSRPSKATPRLDVRITTRSAPADSERVTYRADAGSRRYTLNTDFRGPRSVAVLAPLVALLHDVLAGESIVPFAATAPVDTGTGTPGTSDDDRACSICDLCRNVPGGRTVLGCLGEGLFGGGGGGGGGATPLGPCTISASTALRIFRDVLFSDFGVVDLCETNISSLTSGFATAFARDPAEFKKKRDAALDTLSAGCADCFFAATREFTGTGAELAKLRGTLSGRICIKDYFTLVAEPEYASVTAQAQKYLDGTASCKRRCDATPPAPRRAYCDCLPDYLRWEPTGPRPSSGAASCP